MHCDQSAVKALAKFNYFRSGSRYNRYPQGSSLPLGIPMRLAGPSIIALLTTLPMAVAAGSTPTDFTGTYDGPTDTLTLSWTAPAGNVQEYRIYEGTTLLDTTTGTSYSLTLGPAFPPRSFSVSAVIDDVEGEKTPPISAFRVAPPTDPNCGLIGITTYSGPPYVTYAIHEECLPV